MELNTLTTWRRILGTNNPDLHQKDVEILLRMFAMLLDDTEYSPSMMKFLNQFSKKCQSHAPEQNQYICDLFESFLKSASALPANAFLSKKTQRFSIALVEAVFTAAAACAFRERRLMTGQLSSREIDALARDEEFQNAATKASTTSANVAVRLGLGKKHISAL